MLLLIGIAAFSLQSADACITQFSIPVTADEEGSLGRSAPLRYA